MHCGVAKSYLQASFDLKLAIVTALTVRSYALFALVVTSTRFIARISLRMDMRIVLSYSRDYLSDVHRGSANNLSLSI